MCFTYIGYVKEGNVYLMNSLIVYPLLILFIVSGFSQLYYYSNTDLAYNGTLSDIASGGNQTLTGEEQEISQEIGDIVFNINMITGIVALIIGLVALGVIAGIRILGSGLSEYSVKLIHKSATYYGLWGIFSALSFTAFSGIPTFGLFLWLGLTLIYSLGFFQTLDG